MKMRFVLLPAVAGLALLGAAPSQAQSDLTFNFIQANEQSAPGTAQTFTFDGVLKNNSLTKNLYFSFNDNVISIPGVSQAITDNFPALNASGDLNPDVQPEETGLPVPGKVSLGPDVSTSTDFFFFLGAGQTATVHDLFQITTAAGTPAGTYASAFNFVGGEDIPGGTPGNDMRGGPGSEIKLLPGNGASYSVTLAAPAVPETSSFALLGLGLLPVALIARRRRA